MLDEQKINTSVWGTELWTGLNQIQRSFPTCTFLRYLIFFEEVFFFTRRWEKYHRIACHGLVRAILYRRGYAELKIWISQVKYYSTPIPSTYATCFPTERYNIDKLIFPNKNIFWKNKTNQQTKTTKDCYSAAWCKVFSLSYLI